MARIPIAQVPQLRGASFQQTASTNLLSAEGAALQRAGSAIQQTSRVVDAYQEKRQKLRADATMAQAQVEQANAAADVESYMTKNPDKPETWGEYRESRFAEIDGKLNTEGLKPEHIAAVQQATMKGNAMSETKVRLQSEKRQIENDNALIIQSAKYQIDNGLISDAVTTLNGATMTQEDRVEFLHSNINKGVYSSVGLTLDSLSTPEELEEFKADILEKDPSGFYSKHVADIKIGDDPQAQSIMKVSGLDEGQRKYFARLADQRHKQIVTQQNKNLSSVIRDAKRGNIEDAWAKYETHRDAEDANGFPVEFDEQVEEMIQTAYEGYQSQESLDLLRAQAKTGDGADKYKGVQATIAAATVSPQGLVEFDVNAALKDIKKLKEPAAIKAEMMANALTLAAAKHEQELGEYEQRAGILDFVPFGALYKDTYGKADYSAGEESTLQRTYETFNDMVKGIGYTDDLPKDIADAQKQIYKFYQKNPEATDQQIAEFEAGLIKPMHRKIVAFEKYGASN